MNWTNRVLVKRFCLAGIPSPASRPAFQSASYWVYTPKKPPKFKPDLWEDVRLRANCYSYALNLVNHGKGWPGQLLWRTEKDYDDVDCTPEILREKLISDGLQPIEVSDVGAKKGHVVAAFMEACDSKSPDFHFFRRDRNGRWSHKPGKGAVRDTDFSGQRIKDIGSADTGTYTEFLGYFQVPESGIYYSARLDLAA